MTPHRKLSADIAEQLRDLALGPEEKTALALRQDAISGSILPGSLGDFAEKVRRSSSTISDDDVSSLLRSGSTEDQIFELIVCLALGSGLERLKAGMKALERKA